MTEPIKLPVLSMKCQKCVTRVTALLAVEGALGTLSEIAIGLKTGRPVFLLGSTLEVDGAIPVATPQQAVTAALSALEEQSHG